MARSNRSISGFIFLHWLFTRSGINMYGRSRYEQDRLFLCFSLPLVSSAFGSLLFFLCSLIYLCLSLSRLLCFSLYRHLSYFSLSSSPSVHPSSSIFFSLYRHLSYFFPRFYRAFLRFSAVHFFFLYRHLSYFFLGFIVVYGRRPRLSLSLFLGSHIYTVSIFAFYITVYSSSVSHTARR